MDLVVDNVMENLHRLAMDLRPASLDHLGLEAALRQHIQTLQEKLSLEIKFGIFRVNERLPANMEIALYRIVQEALNNVVRHARATRVDVIIQRRDDILILIVEDNGVGYDPAVAMKSDRLGLFGMRERAEMLGGKLVVESAAGKGTTVFVEVPYASSNSHRG
jgi:signal transduction histidine kinase